MPMLSDVRFDSDALLYDAFDFSRYPIFKTRHAKQSTTPYATRQCGRARALFTVYSNGSPSKTGTCPRSRNVSEPQLISSTNYMRESWFTDVAPARTVDDIANLSSDDDNTLTSICPSQSTTAVCDTPDAHSSCGSGSDSPQKSLRAVFEDSCEVSGHVDQSDYKSEEDSLYSMDSADQDAHPLLLSIPIIPQIKLERKATVRKPDSKHPPDAVQNLTLLSPHVQDIQTPERVSSRRYGRILGRSTEDAVATKKDGHRGLTFKAFRRFGSANWSDRAKNHSTELAYMHSVSEPVLSKISHTPDIVEESLLDEEIDESPSSNVLLSIIEEAGSSAASCSDRSETEGTVDETPNPKQGFLKHSKRSHKRCSLNHSISLSSIVHAVADGCASLDLLLRKPRAKLKSASWSKCDETLANAHGAMKTVRWAPKRGQIVIKVFVPSTDDIWRLLVPQDICLAEFTSMVASKLGFAVCFSGSPWDEPRYYFRTEERFRSWVKGRIRFGRNLPIVAHALPALPLVKLSVDREGCEVWCCA